MDIVEKILMSLIAIPIIGMLLIALPVVLMGLGVDFSPEFIEIIAKGWGY
jgi:hypothetical protein